MTNIRPHDPFAPAAPADPVSEAEIHLRLPANGIKLKASSISSIGVVAAMRDIEAAKGDKARKTVLEALDKRYEQLAAEAAEQLDAAVKEILTSAVGKTADELQAMYEAEEESESPRVTLLEGLDRMVEEAIQREEEAHQAALTAAGSLESNGTGEAPAEGSEGSEGVTEPS